MLNKKIEYQLYKTEYCNKAINHLAFGTHDITLMQRFSTQIIVHYFHFCITVDPPYCNQ
jgi:hypothetical protein